MDKYDQSCPGPESKHIPEGQLNTTLMDREYDPIHMGSKNLSLTKGTI